MMIHSYMLSSSARCHSYFTRKQMAFILQLLIVMEINVYLKKKILIL